MSKPAALPIDDSSWQVPSHEVKSYRAKAHKYALVIPVINEGERIRGQLTRIAQAKLPVDVIIADGGSSDGSLDADFVEPIGVRTVLTKTGPGKLSAQLRMGYAFALREGYAGIVTVDGNGKDGVEAVAQFVAKLEEGCDYVQGSRYLPGGEAENTPLERTLANRLIHAPILSFAGRHIFTDTTNGFRAYSARYLLHPKVQPFRAEFEVYNLLFYLTVRAGQLGLKVDHVPVIRRYPQSGKVPTKIGGLSSKLALLGETVKAASGGYTPDDAQPIGQGFRWPAIVAALILVPLLLSVITSPDYSPDSWALYELSKTVFSDFYRFTHFRSYSSLSEYSSAFAPLWPVLIGVTDAVLGTGARTGLYLSFASFFAFALVSEKIGRVVTGASWFGLSAAFALLLAWEMVWDELSAGRTIPLQLLLFALILSGLLKGRAITTARACGIGFLAGVAVMNRFDAALLPFLLVLMMAAITRNPWRAAAGLAASITAILPWAVYSYSTFGVAFATDNAAIATSLDARAFVTDWWPTPQDSLYDHPGAWLLKVLSNLGPWLLNAATLLATPLGLAFAVAMGALTAVLALCAKAPTISSRSARSNVQFCVLLIFGAAMVALMVPQLLTGYFEYRYYAAPFWIALLAAPAWLISRADTACQRMVLGKCFASVIGLWVIGLVAIHCVSAFQDEGIGSENWARFEAPQEVSQLQECLGEDKDARILVMGDNRFAAKAGALGSLHTMMEPRNMAQGRLDEGGRNAFVEAWDVGYLLVRDPARLPDAARLKRFEPVTHCSLTLFARN